MERTISRTWHPDGLACTVTTGRRFLRGTITATQIDPAAHSCVWTVTTHTGRTLSLTGDYAAAERRLLDATREQDTAELRWREERRQRVLPRWGGPLD